MIMNKNSHVSNIFVTEIVVVHFILLYLKHMAHLSVIVM